MSVATEPERRSAIVVGALLIALGAVVLVARALSIDVFATGWPILVVLVGIAFFGVALAIPGPGGVAFAIPGGMLVVTGIILAFQAATGLWSTWAYVWALVAPGGVGLGLVVYGVVTGDRGLVRAGLVPLAIGVALFVGFGLFFEGVLGLNIPRGTWGESVLAVGMVVIGIVVIGLAMFRRSAPRA